jgi:hypothetical protein
MVVCDCCVLRVVAGNSNQYRTAVHDKHLTGAVALPHEVEIPRCCVDIFAPSAGFFTALALRGSASQVSRDDPRFFFLAGLALVMVWLTQQVLL